MEYVVLSKITRRTNYTYITKTCRHRARKQKKKNNAPNECATDENSCLTFVYKANADEMGAVRFEQLIVAVALSRKAFVPTPSGAIGTCRLATCCAPCASHACIRCCDCVKE